MARMRLVSLVLTALALALTWKAISVWPGASGPIAPAEAQTAAKPPASAPPPLANPPVLDVGGLTKTEFEVLEGLAKRREALEARDRDMDLRENLLAVAEKRVRESIAELKELEAKISAMLERQENSKERDVRSLVKIYENMKPKDAARIFDQLDLPVLLDVAQRMKEAKLAPVLAVMDSGRAQKVTVELASRRNLGSADKPRGG